MKLSFILILMVLLSTVNAQAGETVLTENPDVASNLRLLDAWIESRLAYDNQPAMNIGIVYGQKLIWAKSYGFSDRENRKEASLDDIYLIASQSKMFTAVAILKLRDEGKLQLDDPVSRRLPGFDIKNSYPDAPPITIRHLLAHISGVPSEAAFPYWTDFSFPEMKQVLDKLKEQETVYPSETKWKYSNLGYTLAGAIVEAVSGMPYADYIQRNILDPLGMSSTSVTFPEENKQKMARGYGRRLPGQERKLMPFTDARGIAACGGFSSTVGDMARFASWIFRLRSQTGAEIIKSSTIKEMQRVQWLMPNWQSGWGLGFGINHTPQRDIVFHGGWVAGYRSNLSMSLDEKVAVIVMQNADDATTLVVDRVFDWVAPAINRATAVTAENPVVDPDWEKLTGKYRNWFSDTQILVYQNRLAMINPTAANPAESMFFLIPEGENTFRISGSGWGSHGELVSFELGPDGAVLRMKEGENYLYPVK